MTNKFIEDFSVKWSGIEKKNVDDEREDKFKKPTILHPRKDEVWKLLNDLGDYSEKPFESKQGTEPESSSEHKFTYGDDGDNLEDYFETMETTWSSNIVVREAFWIEKSPPIVESILKNEEIISRKKVRFNDFVSFRDNSYISPEETTTVECLTPKVEATLQESFLPSELWEFEEEPKVIPRIDNSTSTNIRPRRAAAANCLLFIDNITKTYYKRKKNNLPKPKVDPKSKKCRKISRKKGEKKFDVMEQIAQVESNDSPQPNCSLHLAISPDYFEEAEFSWIPNQSLLDASF